MLILTDAMRPIVAARVKLPDCASLTDAAAADVLSAPSVPNPVPQGTVPKPFHLADVMAALSTASLANVEAIPYLPSVIADFEAGNLDGCAKWVGLFLGTAKITPAEAGAIVAIMKATEPDPAWVPLVSWWTVTFGPTDLAQDEPGQEFDPQSGRWVAAIVTRTYHDHCTAAMVAEARASS